MQMSHAVALGPPLYKAANWRVQWASCAVASLLVWWFRQQGSGTGDIVLALRFAAICLAGGLAFALDDPSEDTTSMTPVSVLLRRAVKLALAAPLPVLVWALLVGYASGSPGSDPIPLWPFIIEMVAAAAVALGAAAVGSRYLADRMGGVVGAVVPLLMASVVAFTPGAARLWNLTPGVSGYAAAARWWALVTVMALGTFVWFGPVGNPSLRSRAKRRAQS